MRQKRAQQRQERRVTGAVAEGAGVVGRRIGNAYTESRTVPQIDVDRDAIKNAAMRGVQPKMMSGLRSMMKSLESDAGIEKPVGAAPEVPTNQQSIRDTVKQTSDNFLDRAKSIYASLDKATGGQFQRFDNQLREVNEALNQLVNTPDEASMNAEAELDARRAKIETARDAAFDRAKAQGVDPNLIESARADFKRGQALKDLDYNIKKVASGARPTPETLPADLAKDPEMLHPERLQKRLDTMYDSGRLQEAVGNENADKMLADISKHKVQVQQTAREALDAAQRNANVVRDAAARRIAKNRGIRYATDAAGLAAASRIPVVGPVIQKAAQAVTHTFVPGVGIKPIQKEAGMSTPNVTPSPVGFQPLAENGQNVGLSTKDWGDIVSEQPVSNLRLPNQRQRTNLTSRQLCKELSIFRLVFPRQVRLPSLRRRQKRTALWLPRTVRKSHFPKACLRKIYTKK